MPIVRSPDRDELKGRKGEDEELEGYFLSFTGSSSVFH
jgi:hypothetical protein